jgi:hypothetical protein
MAVTEKCNARNRATCRFHGALDHARMDVDKAKEKYDKALDDYNNFDPVERDAVTTSRYGSTKTLAPVKTRVNNARTGLNKAQAALDAFPAELKKLKSKLDDAQANDPGSKETRELEKRHTKAVAAKKQAAAKAAQEKARVKAEADAQQKAKEAFARISGEVQAEKNNPVQSWRAGYKAAVSGVLLEEGQIVSAGSPYASISYRGTYHQYERTSADQTAHVRKCGALDVRNIEEDSWDEWDFDSMASTQKSHQEFGVHAEVTCNCGEIVGARIETSGTFSELTSRVLKF